MPQLPDGKILVDDSAESGSIRRFVEAARKLNIPTTRPRRATGTLASSVNLLLPDALATGNLTLVPNAVVREITVDTNTARPNGVSVVDRRSRRQFYVPARAVVLSASSLESTRILLNSVSSQHPNGLGNSSGVLGHYLFDQIYVKGVVTAIVPEARGGKAPRNLMGGAGYVVRFRNVGKRDQKFLRGYTYDFGSGGTPSPRVLASYGEPLLRRLEDLRGTAFSMTTMGEVLPRFENHVRINKDVKDAWGIPVLHITHRYTDNERLMAQDSMEVAEQLCRTAGFEVLAKHSQMVPPGESIHELGTCRMGDDRKKSVLNRWNQCHDAPNLFVVDGSSFVTGGAQNPTLTLLALSLRASEYLAERLRRREL